jgi:hypothetical protein
LPGQFPVTPSFVHNELHPPIFPLLSNGDYVPMWSRVANQHFGDTAMLGSSCKLKGNSEFGS